MDSIYLYLMVGAAVVFFFLGWYLRIIGRKELSEAQNASPSNTQVTTEKSMDPEVRRLKLQAYERLMILCERIGLENLLSRFQLQALTVAQLEKLLTQAIRSEYEYNISQQIYVSPAAWDGISKLKEQQIFIIHQLASMDAPEAPAQQLAQKIIALLAEDENATLQPTVAQLLRQEAAKLM